AAAKTYQEVVEQAFEQEKLELESIRFRESRDGNRQGTAQRRPSGQGNSGNQRQDQYRPNFQTNSGNNKRKFSGNNSQKQSFQQSSESGRTQASSTGDFCRFCKKTGHLIKNCPNVKCRRCGLKGHIEWNCSGQESGNRMVPAPQPVARQLGSGTVNTGPQNRGQAGSNVVTPGNTSRVYLLEDQITDSANCHAPNSGEPGT
ncbi:hypothetical protein JQN44_27225, partial [Klebsiella pneumoniae]|nr:hypothetical protein [Klebsiella pneumoniae]